MLDRITASIAVSLCAVALACLPARAAQSPQIPLPASAVPQFVEALPDLEPIVAGTETIELQMTEFSSMVLPAGAVPGYTGTTVWGYLKPGQATRSSYIGPVIVATRNVPTELKFVNNLGNTATSRLLAYLYSTDQTLHWADPLNYGENMCAHMAMAPAPGDSCAENYAGPIPAVVHLHGGEVPPQLDGGPDAWFTSDGITTGAGFYSKDGNDPKNYSIYRYPNSQEAAPIWFHDHTLGATRLNVYAGLAGGYLLTDPANDPQNLPPLIPLVIQDRMFDTTGQLLFTAGNTGGIPWALNPEHPYWNPEFVGDVIVVNGKSWPFKNVDPKRYTFLFLNGSNARTYEMFLTDPVSGNFGPSLWVIGTDGGYLDKPVQIDPRNGGKLVLMPGERYQVIVDFAGYEAGQKGPNGKKYSGRWVLRNVAKTPYPGGAAPQGATTGRIMQFVVVGPGTSADTSFNPAAANATLRGGTSQGPSLVRLTDPARGTLAPGVAVQTTRQLTLNEVMGMPVTAVDPITGLTTAYPGGPLEILVNNTKWSGKRIIGASNGMYEMEPIPGFTPDGNGNYLSELPREGETEIWELVNLTADAHPIHLHLVQFQLMNRQAFNTMAYTAAYDAAFPGGGYDPMTGLPYPKGVYIPGWGPPLEYQNGNVRAVGGNPDIAATTPKGRPLYLQGPTMPPLPQEAGWKDTIIAYPGQVTRLAVRWAPTDLPASTPPSAAGFSFDPNGGQGYVWHCHIIDHEDNEMMRPDQVMPNPAAVRSYLMGTDF